MAWFSVTYLSSSDLLIITHYFNRPDFIALQYKTFKQFLHDDYEYIIFNDAQDLALEHQINDVCKSLGIRCIRVPQTGRSRPANSPTTSSWRHSQAIEYSMNKVGFKHDGLVMMIDSDMFLIKDFSVKDFLQDSDIAGIRQVREGMTYLWPGLIFFRMNKLHIKKLCDSSPVKIMVFGLMPVAHYITTSKRTQKFNVLFFEQKYRLFLDKNSCLCVGALI